MKKLKWICAALALVLCLCILGNVDSVAAAGQIEIWTTSMQYDLELTEPLLMEQPEGKGIFTASVSCRDSVAGESVKAVAAFYGDDGRMLGCWMDSFTLENGGSLRLEGELPEYAKVGIYFFEADSLTPIRPAVMRLLDGQAQVTAAELAEVKTELESRLSELEEKIDSLWAGKSVVFVGDSITAGTGTTKTYCEYLAESMDFGSVTVMGVPGSCMSTTSDYGTGNSPLINRWKNIPDAELIVVFMGTNDYGHETPLGSIDDSGDVSFYGALNEIVPGILNAHPDSRVVFMTPLHRYGAGTSGILGTGFTYDYLPNGRGYTLEDYTSALKEVCARWSVPVIDLYSNSGIHPAISAQKQSYMTDGIHPNAAGHEKIAAYIANALELYGMSGGTATQPEAPENPDSIAMQYGNKFVSDSNSTDPTRASSSRNLWLTAGQTVMLLDTESYVWALGGTSTAISNNLAHGYYPESQWSSIGSYTVEKDGWYGVTIKNVDGSDFSFEDGADSDELFDYIVIN